MAAFLVVLQAIWTGIWSIISPVKYYVLVAIVAIVVWQKAVVDTAVLGYTPWDTTAIVVSVDSGTALTVDRVASDLLNQKRQVVLQGVLMDATTLNKLLPAGTVVSLHVTDGHKLGNGQLTGVVNAGGAQ
jgi:hypothetical protein